MRKRRVIQMTAFIAALVLGGATVTLTASGEPEPVARDSEWSGFTVSRYGLSGMLPSGWRLTATSQTPRLHDPREIVTAATFSPGPAAKRCNHLPVAAIAAMGRTDALVSIQERGRNARIADFPARPARFAATDSPGTAQIIQQCIDTPMSARVSWQEFGDGTRAFHALVVLGADADSTTEAEALGILDRLRFDQRFKPDWDFAG